MAGRMYAITLTPTAVSATVDLLEITAADDFPVIIHSAVFTLSASTTNAQFLTTAKILPATFTSGSGGGGAATVSLPNTHTATTASFATEMFNTTQASTSGTAQVMDSQGWAAQSGYVFQPDPDKRPIIYQGQGFIFTMTTAAGAVVAGTVWVEEL